MKTRTERNPNIVIFKDLNVFGYKISGSDKENGISREIYIHDNHSIILGIYNDESGNMAHLPIYPYTLGKTQLEFLNEICKLNTGHNSYQEYKNSICKQD
jgi:hypothetical protein